MMVMVQEREKRETVKWKENKRLIRLASAHNVRTLGGYKTEDGCVTNNRFIRSDCFMPLAAEDAEKLWDYGVRTVIDLRNQDECDKIPSGLKGYDGVEYVSCPFFPENERPDLDISKLPAAFTMAALYKDMLDNHPSAIRNFFVSAANAPDGKILFHCSAGKDRTGVISALLLTLSGVDDATVIRDYALTEILLEKMFATLKKNSGIPTLMGNVEKEMLGSKPHSMEILLTHLRTKYGDVRSYLRTIGVSEQEMETVKNGMLKREVNEDE